MERNPVGWFEIYVADMDRARRFYEAVFGLPLERIGSPDLEMWAFPAGMNRAGCGGALVKSSQVAPGGNSIMVYFSCADCAVEAGRAEAAGGSVLRPKMSIGQYGFVALVRDTEGNMIGLHSLS